MRDRSTHYLFFTLTLLLPGYVLYARYCLSIQAIYDFDQKLKAAFEQDLNPTEHAPLILMWTKWFNGELYLQLLLPSGPNSCPIASQCRMSYDQSKYPEADAVY